MLFTFWETPCWASTAPEALKRGCSGAWWNRGVQRYPPADARDYGDALAFLVRRYGDRVAAWELWNEPNHPHYFRTRRKAAEYAALVKAAYPAAKAADPKATIIAGSLADADFEFTQELLDRGVGGNFDAWSVHPYSEDRSPLHPGIAGWTKKSFAVGVPKVRATLLRNRQRKPIWLTEFGWSTCTVRGQAPPTTTASRPRPRPTTWARRSGACAPGATCRWAWRSTSRTRTATGTTGCPTTASTGRTAPPSPRSRW